MLVLEILSWLFFGLIFAEMADFFLERRDGRGWGYLVTGAVAGFGGGVLGKILDEVLLGDGDTSAGGYSFIALGAAIIVAALAIAVDRRYQKSRGGVLRTLDARRDLP